MRYDERIINPVDNILTPFGITPVTDIYIGSEGYFGDKLESFYNLDKCSYGVLNAVKHTAYDEYADAPYLCYVDETVERFFSYFLPTKYVKTEKKKEKTYKPFINTEEFFIKTNFEMGDTIRIRSKIDKTEYHLMLVGWTDNELMLGNMQGLTFKELFHYFELWDGENKFQPFGVED